MIMIKGTRKYNFIHNKRLSGRLVNGGMINGQARGAVAEMRYGLCPMSFNGCEVISVYNALVWLKRPVPLCDVAFYMERFKVLYGIFGCNVYSIGKALQHFGVVCGRSEKYADSDIFIVSFWTGRMLLSSVHTVFCVQKNGFIQVYNRYNGCTEIRKYRSIDEISPPERIIAVYDIKGG